MSRYLMMLIHLKAFNQIEATLVYLLHTNHAWLASIRDPLYLSPHFHTFWGMLAH